MSQRDIEEKGLAFLAEVKKLHAQLNLSSVQNHEYAQLLLAFQSEMLLLSKSTKWDNKQLLELRKSARLLHNFISIVNNVQPQSCNAKEMSNSCTNLCKEIVLVRQQLSKKTPNWQTFFVGFGLLLVGAAIITAGAFIPPLGAVLGSVALGFALEFIIPIMLGGMIAGPFALMGVGAMFLSFTEDKPKLDGMSRKNLLGQLAATPPVVVVNDEKPYKPQNDITESLLDRQPQADSGPINNREQVAQSSSTATVSNLSIFSPVNAISEIETVGETKTNLPEYK